MIEILPLKDREKEKELLCGIEGAGADARILALQERGEMLGYAAVELQDGALRLLKLSAAGYDGTEKPDMEQTFLLDSLMRAAASYGETFGANRIVTTFPDFWDFFKHRGFETDETHAFTPMGTIVRYESGSMQKNTF